MTVPAPTSEQRRRRTSRWPTLEERETFLEALGAGWSVAHAAKRAGVTRQRFYDLRDADQDFAGQWEQALEEGLEALVDEVRRRAVEGWEEPIYQKGELVGHVRRYSDNLLMFLTKQRDPSFRENARIEVTGRDGGPVELQAGYTPTTLADVVQLAGELGVLEQLGYQRAEQGDVIDGEARELPAGEAV